MYFGSPHPVERGRPRGGRERPLDAPSKTSSSHFSPIFTRKTTVALPLRDDGTCRCFELQTRGTTTSRRKATWTATSSTTTCTRTRSSAPSRTTSSTRRRPTITSSRCVCVHACLCRRKVERTEGLRILSRFRYRGCLRGGSGVSFPSPSPVHLTPAALSSLPVFLFHTNLSRTLRHSPISRVVFSWWHQRRRTHTPPFSDCFSPPCSVSIFFAPCELHPKHSRFRTTFDIPRASLPVVVLVVIPPPRTQLSLFYDLSLLFFRPSSPLNNGDDDDGAEQRNQERNLHALGQRHREHLRWQHAALGLLDSVGRGHCVLRKYRWATARAPLHLAYPTKGVLQAGDTDLATGVRVRNWIHFFRRQSR